MGGVRLGGIGVVNIISPPFAAFDGPATSGDPLMTDYPTVMGQSGL